MKRTLESSFSGARHIVRPSISVGTPRYRPGFRASSHRAIHPEIPLCGIEGERAPSASAATHEEEP
jgi:hypothetical protein